MQGKEVIRVCKYQIVLEDHGMGIALYEADSAEEALTKYLANRAAAAVRDSLEPTDGGGARCRAPDGTRLLARPVHPPKD